MAIDIFSTVIVFGIFVLIAVTTYYREIQIEKKLNQLVLDINYVKVVYNHDANVIDFRTKCLEKTMLESIEAQRFLTINELHKIKEKIQDDLEKNKKSTFETNGPEIIKILKKTMS